MDNRKGIQASNTTKGNPFAGIFWVILTVLLLNWLIFPNIAKEQIRDTDYVTFINKLDSGKVKDVAIKSGQIYFTTEEGGKTYAYETGATNDPQLVDRLLKAKSPNKNRKVTFTQIVPRENSPLLNFILMWVLPGLIVTGGLKPGEGIVAKGTGLVREGTQVK